jgi:hypothetical protein
MTDPAAPAPDRRRDGLRERLAWVATERGMVNLTYDRFIEIVEEALAEAAPPSGALDVEWLAEAIHEYGGVCQSRYGRRYCQGKDHGLMADAIAAEYARLTPEPSDDREAGR